MQRKNDAGPNIIVALDYSDAGAALSFVNQLRPDQVRLKVGKELFAVGGPQFVETLIEKGFDVFLDLKYHDIPNTVAKAVKASAALGVWMLNVHASGGQRMLDAAREALAGLPNPPLLIGVTVLTSMSADDLRQIGITETPQAHVLRLARLCSESGLDGVVCSSQEATLLKEAFGQDFKLVTPGIRPAGSAADDQRRTLTPLEAITAGSDYLVIGRPITQAADPLMVCESIINSLKQ